MTKTKQEEVHEYNQQFINMEWYNRKERMTTTLTYGPTKEKVKIIIEGRGGLNKDIRDILLTTGFDWHQGDLMREPIIEE